MRTKTQKLAGIIALLVLITFNFTDCKNSDDDEDNGGGGNGGGTTALGEKLELSGQVYTENWNPNYTSLNYVNYTGDLTIIGGGYYNDLVEGSGSVTGGILNYTIGRPNNLYPTEYFLDDLSEANGSDVSANPSSVQGYELFGLSTTNGDLYRHMESYNVSGSSYSETSGYIVYYYVDRDVSVSGKGGTFPPYEYTEDGFTYKETYTNRSFNLALKAGWNTVRFQYTYNATFTGSFDNPTSWNATAVVTVTLDNPSSFRWVYYGGYGGYSMSLSRSFQNTSEAENRRAGHRVFSRYLSR